MVYFLSAVDPSLQRSGLEKRCYMWWHHWKREKQSVQWVALPQQWRAGGWLNQFLLRWIPYGYLPLPVQLFLFFSSSPVHWMIRHNRLLKRILSQRLKPDDVIFIFRAYNVYYLSDAAITDLLGQAKQVVIDFDESDYLSLSTFDSQMSHWPSIRQYVRDREQLLFSFSNVAYYVSGENERARINAQYKPVQPVRVLYNKLAISPPLHHRRLSEPVHLLLIGTYTYKPNLEMIEDLLADILPQLPNSTACQFHIVGHGIPASIGKELTKYDCVTVYGRLSDAALNELYNMIHLNLTLVRSGGGTKYKLVEALAHGLPIVATAQSVEGLLVEPMKHYIPVTSHTFETSLRLLTQELYEIMQYNCQAVYSQHYQFDPVVD